MPVIAVALWSCNSSTDEVLGENTNHFPIANNNTWFYKVLNNDNEEVAEDEMRMGNDVVIGEHTYKEVETIAPFFGFYVASMNGNAIRQQNGRILLRGTFSLGDDFPFDLNFDLNDFVIFDANAQAGVQLSSVNGSFQETIDEIPITFNYQLLSFHDGKLDSFTNLQNLNFTDIIKSKIVLKLNVTTQQELLPGFPPLTLQILPLQDVVVSTQHYANNVGMVYNQTIFKYELNPALSSFNIELPFPNTFLDTQKEVLYDFNVF